MNSPHFMQVRNNLWRKEQDMNIEEAKNIKLADYLQSLGYHPAKQQGNSLWYNSPFREEKEPSFKINLDRNEWYDFGIGKGGNIIALAAELYHIYNVSDLLCRIEEKAPYIRPVAFFFPQQTIEPSFQNLEAVPLTHPALIRYLQERGINTELAKRECKELHFVSNGKPYFAVGFPNQSGGYEVRNPFFKGCAAPKDITHIRQQGEPKSTCFLFEGFVDYLSFLTLRTKSNPQYPCLDWQDYIILNSTSNLSKAMYPLADYEHIHCFLDNDKAGVTIFQEITKEYGMRVRDASRHYSEYKDLNDFLCDKKCIQSTDLPRQTKQAPQPPKKNSRGFRM